MNKPTNLPTLPTSLLNQLIELALENVSIESDSSTYHLENHFDDDEDAFKDFAGQELPSKQKLILAIKQNKSFRKQIDAVIDAIADDLILAFDQASENFQAAETNRLEQEREEAEAFKERAEYEAAQKAKQKKLLANFTPSQIELLKKDFNLDL